MTWITGISRARAKSSAERAFPMTRFASSGLTGIVATSLSRWPRCISTVTMAASFASGCNSLCSPAKRLERSTISMLAMLERVGVGERLFLHAFVVHAHHARHARGIAVEIGERADERRVGKEGRNGWARGQYKEHQRSHRRATAHGGCPHQGRGGGECRR